MLMPARFQVDDADYGRLKDAVAAPGGTLVRDAATTRFAEASRRLRLPRFDALPPLRAALPGPDVFFQQTVHLTPRGHEIVAAGARGASSAGRDCSADGLQLPALRLVLPRRLRAVPLLPAVAPSSGRTAARTGCCSSPATTSTRRGTIASSRCWPRRRSSTTHAAIVLGRLTDQRRRRLVMGLSIGFNLAMLGFFKYFNFFADNLHALFAAVGLAARLRHAARAAADRHLVLHVRDDELRHRRVPPRDRADAQPGGLRGLRGVLPAPGRGTDPPGDGAAAADRAAAPHHRARRCATALWLIAWGFFQKIFVADNLAPIAIARLRARRARSPASTCCSAPMPSPSRSTATSRATPTSRAARRS